MHIPLSSFSVSLLITMAHREHLLDRAHLTDERVHLCFSERIDACSSWIDVSDDEARDLLAALLEAHYEQHVLHAQPKVSC